MKALSNVRIVLARPSEARNIGATCRAMKNAGLTRLSIVTHDGIDRDAARPLAVNATEILDAAVITGSLVDAVTGSSLVAGVTRRTGQKRKDTAFSPWELADFVLASGEGAVSIVFGNERSGLSDEELGECHVAVSIPAAPEQPSLNLSHAVQVIAYELYKAARVDLPKRTHVPMPIEAVRDTVSQIVESLSSIGYLTQDGPQGMPTLLVDLLSRASVSHREARRLRELFHKLAGMCRDEG